ncbi:MAG: Ribosomal RNA large subunit methyltransferase E [Mycoplasmataceae bacterium]|nr:MAG: Ribosomal RNA large subunit methyltransferase E [Mycoplasmataceae bacterium]
MESCNCQPTHWFWKWTYRISFIALLIFVIFQNMLLDGIDNKLYEINERERKKQIEKKIAKQKQKQEWVEIFNEIGKAFEKENKRMENEEKARRLKMICYQLGDGETYQGLTREDIKNILKRLGYWNDYD